MSFEQIADELAALLAELPETISLEDVRRHPGLGRLVLAADDMANRIDRRALSWLKEQG